MELRSHRHGLIGLQEESSENCQFGTAKTRRPRDQPPFWFYSLAATAPFCAPPLPTWRRITGFRRVQPCRSRRRPSCRPLLHSEVACCVACCRPPRHPTCFHQLACTLMRASGPALSLVHRPAAPAHLRQGLASGTAEMQCEGIVEDGMGLAWYWHGMGEGANNSRLAQFPVASYRRGVAASEQNPTCLLDPRNVPWLGFCLGHPALPLMLQSSTSVMRQSPSTMGFQGAKSPWVKTDVSDRWSMSRTSLPSL